MKQFIRAELPGIDPVVLHDSIADRWVISRSTGPFHTDTYQCIAVSATPDPLGPWNRYAFLMPLHHFEDYAKIGVWPDGYYMSGDEFSSDLLISANGHYDRSAEGVPDVTVLQFEIFLA